HTRCLSDWSSDVCSSDLIMFILAAGGATVVKHGNRSVTSKSGSADVLEQLGVQLQLRPEDLQQCLERHGCAFIFARQYHPAFREIGRASCRERGWVWGVA